MEELNVFKRLPITCNISTGRGTPGQIFIPDAENDQNLVNCYAKAAMNVAEEYGYNTRHQTKYRYVSNPETLRTEYRCDAIVSIRQPGITIMMVQRLMNYIHMHAEILYATHVNGAKNSWSMLYDRTPPRQGYP